MALPGSNELFDFDLNATGETLVSNNPVFSDRRKVTQVAVLSWFLMDQLPKFYPEIFDDSIRIRPVKDQGWSNYSFAAKAKGGQEYIIRMKEKPEGVELNSYTWNDYFKEAFVLEHLAGKVPVAGIIDKSVKSIGGLNGLTEYALMVQERLEGEGANFLSKHDSRYEFLAKLATHMAAVNSTPTIGFGSKILPNSICFQHSCWEDCLAEWIAECPIAELAFRDCLSVKQAEQVHSRLMSLENLKFEPTLYHGDVLFNWSNVLVNDSFEIEGIIDWEFAGSGPAKHYELMTALYVLIRDGEEFSETQKILSILLNSYNISHKDFESVWLQHIDALMLMQVVKKMKRYLDAEANGEFERHPFRRKFLINARNLLLKLVEGGCSLDL